MINFTQVSYFTFGAYFNIGLFKYLFFLIIMCFYALIVCANLLLIVVICKNRSLHEPMYLFLCSLFVNELYGSTGLFPFLLVQILSDIHTVSVPFCFLQIFCVYTYGCVEFSNLAIMSYDRYLAICYPLQYNTRMTYNKVAVLIALTWLFPFFAIAVPMSLSSSLQLCGNIINTVYCDNYSIVKLACSDTAVNNIYGLINTCLVVFVALIILILYSYMRILKVCFSGSKQTRQKAVSTCTPHLLSLLNFSFGSFFEVVQGRFNMNSLPIMLRIFLSLYWLTCQPLFNPVMYGLKISKIRNICRSLGFGITQHCRDGGGVLDYGSAIRLDNRIRERRCEKTASPRLPVCHLSTPPRRFALEAAETPRLPTSSSEPEAMEVGCVQLSSEERARRINARSCLYCDLPPVAVPEFPCRRAY
ncbi:olfactory receptor 2A14-like [Perca fluviatilis]|uniref:olfactory receptor 2A14-like n=1 Tax=Perca fluviatilis TaxID=8168 RepID=UPI001966105C|nr:olfactory receptor 2A14-like [Perca fluviatilis]